MPFVYSVRGTHTNPKEVSPKSPSTYLKITGGDKIYTAGGYVIHCFLKTGDSELNIVPVSQDIPSSALSLVTNSLAVEYLVVGGGGAGGSRHGGGGGAGAYTTGVTTLALGPNAITVGAGGASIVGDSTGNPGQASQLTPLIQVRGGGGGGSWGSTQAGQPGGSGGGGSGSNNPGGTAVAPSAFPTANGYWGNPGGRSTPWDNPISLLRVGGGGGAGEAGENAELIGPNGQGRNQRGGDGKGNSITGVNYYWAGGGGGASWNETGGQGGRGGGGGGCGNPAGLGGTGINSGGNSDAEVAGADGVGGNGGTNTGGGGGGGQQVPSTGGAGGPGIVVVRYRR